MALSAIDKMLRDDGVELEEDTVVGPDEPLYRVVGDSKIPVSAKMGVLWESRRCQGLADRNQAQTRWDEAIRYYENDQITHRGARDNSSGNTPYSRRLNNEWTETENVVFANASIMVPMLYAKNPTITASTSVETNQALAIAVQELCNKLMSMRSAPGIGLKTKMRRNILMTLLTNSGWVKINWVSKSDSSEQALVDLEKLTEELQSAKTIKQIKEVEGKIAALEETVNLLSPAGPTVKLRSPHHIVVDPTAEEPDGSDANWMMEWDYLPTEYLNAVYGKKSGEQVVSVYEPTHIMMAAEASAGGVQDEVDNFKLMPDDGEAKPNAYGYKSEAQLKAASMTKVWWVWDRTTRRVFLFADNYWRWPVWVWDDPLQLPRFFPYFRLWFHEGTAAQNSKGEVTYYLDQQDAINEINDEVRRGRAWAKRNLFYNKKVISQEDVEAVLKGPDGTARGVSLEEGTSLNDAIMSIVPPALKFPELFNTDTKFSAIDRITGVNAAMRGGQFKTNTTNKAVDTYQQNVDIRIDERTDLIEDFIADIMWNIAMLCMMRWDTADVAQLIGQAAAGWRRISDAREFDTLVNLRVEAGSIGKPNSREMKQQAVQLGQVLGQFANAAPAVVLVMVKMFERAFQGQIVITPEDWQMIEESMTMALTKAGSGPGGEGEQEPPDPNAEPAQSDEQLKEQVRAQIEALPPQAKAMLEQLVSQGEPPAEALKTVQQQVQSATS